MITLGIFKKIECKADFGKNYTQLHFLQFFIIKIRREGALTKLVLSVTRFEQGS